MRRRGGAENRRCSADSAARLNPRLPDSQLQFTSPWFDAGMPRILLADDEPAFRSLFELWLRSADFDVTVVCDGVEALASMVAEGVPDAVILDVNMPRLDGFELCRVLRRLRPQLPVVLISARDDLAELGRLCGANAVLGKPSSAAGLRGVVGNLLTSGPPAVYAA